MEIETYHIETVMGSVTKNGRSLPFLTKKELKNLNQIGYSGKLMNKKISKSEYLNSLNKGQFQVTQTKWDNGSFTEEFTIVRVI